MLKCIENTISGKNLDYEYLLWIEKNANQLGLKGITFFKNDGSIKVITEGEEENLFMFMNKLKRGPYYFSLFSPVENFATTWQEPKNEFVDFSISETTE